MVIFGDVCFLFLHLFMWFFCLFLWDITTPSRFHCLEGSTFNGTWEIPPELGGTATIVVSHWDLTNVSAGTWEISDVSAGDDLKKNAWDFLELQQQNMEDGMHKTMGHHDGSCYVRIPEDTGDIRILPRVMLCSATLNHRFVGRFASYPAM